MLNIGVSSKVFSSLSVSDAASAMSSSGFKCTELSLSHPDLAPNDGKNPISFEMLSEAVEEFVYRGVDIVALSLDTGVRRSVGIPNGDDISAALGLISLAAEAKIPYVTCGFIRGEGFLGFKTVTAATFEDDYALLRSILRTLCVEAGKCGVSVALGADMFSILPSPRSLKLMIEDLEEETGARLHAIINPTDTVMNSDEEGMFYYLKNDAAMIKYSSSPRLKPVSVDWAHLMERYVKFAEGKPFIISDVREGDTLSAIKKRAEDSYNKAFTSVLSRIG